MQANVTHAHVQPSFLGQAIRFPFRVTFRVISLWLSIASFIGHKVLPAPVMRRIKGALGADHRAQ